LRHDSDDLVRTGGRPDQDRAGAPKSSVNHTRSFTRSISTAIPTSRN
jgi:hypothetical protein